MVLASEHMRTTLQETLDIEKELRGSISGMAMPQFVVDLPGGGGKRIASTYEEYDRATGVSKFTAEAITGRDKVGRVYQYYDPAPAREE
jgi:lysine 2,3-aminomutase